MELTDRRASPTDDERGENTIRRRHGCRAYDVRGDREHTNQETANVRIHIISEVIDLRTRIEKRGVSGQDLPDFFNNTGGKSRHYEPPELRLFIDEVSGPPSLAKHPE